jgi:similar to stage IV sporulation protein
MGLEGKVQEEKILQRNIKSGKVVLKIHFDVIEDIAAPKPILQGE